MLPGVNVYSPICDTGVTSAALPVTKHSVNVESSSGRMCRSITSKPCFRASLISDWRVMPFRNQSGSGVWITPSRTKNTFEPVLSAT